jgi:hypothetical protein
MTSKKLQKENSMIEGIANQGFNADNQHVDQQNHQRKNIHTLNEKKLEETFSYKKIKSENAFRSAGRYIKKYYKPSPTCLKNYFFHRFPFFEWILQYDLKNDLVKDIIAGLTVSNLICSLNYILKIKIKNYNFSFKDWYCAYTAGYGLRPNGWNPCY